ncbi:MAG: DUF3822 family protein [Cyclobacteriaceae bacterium]|nr:DUF3822 family protein [Cyclobacteriaceae bacterium]
MAEVFKKPYRKLKGISDPKFEIDRLDYYDLFIILGDRDLQILIHDTQDNRPVLFEDYVLDETGGSNLEKIDLLRMVFDDHTCLQAGFWNQITISFKNRKFSQIPAYLFNDEIPNVYLELNCDFEASNETLISRELKEAGIVNVFAIPSLYIEFFDKIYPRHNIRYDHQSTAIINGVLNSTYNSSQFVIVYIDRFSMHISAASKNRLIFYNQYPIKSFEDYLRFIKIAASEIHVDLHKDQIFVYGHLGNKTPHFDSLKKHIHNLAFGQRPSHLHFGWVFDDLEEHQYMDVFCQVQKY